MHCEIEPTAVRTRKTGLKNVLKRKADLESVMDKETIN